MMMHDAFLPDGIYCESERLLLRSFRPEDQEPYLDLYRAKDSLKPLFENPTLEAGKEMLRCLDATNVLHAAIIRKADGLFCGFCCLQGLDTDQAPEIGIELAEVAHHQGIAYESLTMLMNRWTELTGTRHFTSCVDMGNTPSNRLMERLGYVRTETIESPTSIALRASFQERLQLASKELDSATSQEQRDRLNEKIAELKELLTQIDSSMVRYHFER